MAVCCMLQTNAQNTSYNIADTLAGHFIKNMRNNDMQKVMLHTDRNVYVAGEKIWFKAFVVHALNNRLDTTSKNLFVDLVDDNDKVIKQLVLNAARLQTDGAITLGDSLATGYYWLRCYTQQILHNDVTGMVVQPVFIKNLNPNSQHDDYSQPTRKTVSNHPVINFYPEGGALIAGINSTGAIKITDAFGNPVQASGIITDAADSTVTSFSTNKYGLARVTFYPAWFKKYFAQVILNGQKIKYPLAEWSPFSAQIAINRQSGDFIQAYVTLEDSIYTRKYTTYILGISGDSLCFAGVGRGMYQLDIPLANFPGGIATLLLFNGNQQLISERKIFVNKPNYNLLTQSEKPVYTSRDKAHINLELKGRDGKPLVGLLNVSVQDNRLQQMSDEMKADTLMPMELYGLNDWLKQHAGSFSAADIDLFMLAQPPAYTHWQNLNTAKAYTDNTDLLNNIAGEVLNRKQQPARQKIITAISLTGKNPYFALDTTNEVGGFSLPLPVNSENLFVKMQVKNKHSISENDSIFINNFDFPKVATPAELKRRFSNGSMSMLQRITAYHIDTVFAGTGKEWLAPVIVKSKTKKIETDYDDSKRVSNFSYLIHGEKLGHGQFGEVGNAVLMTPGVSYMGGKLVIHGMNSMTSMAEPIIIMDGVQVTGTGYIGDTTKPLDAFGPNSSPDMEFLNSLDSRSIDFIEVLRGPEAAIYGANSANGVIIVNSKARANTFERDISAFKIVKPVTYHTAPKFDMPDYSIKTVKNSKTPDPRTTIYWNPNLVTGTDGKASIDFYTGDDVTGYTVTISGITANGEYISKRININRK